ncbi:MAG: YbaB/EbfC family nucleoid-associated protein [Candidatus Binatia bacterium]
MANLGDLMKQAQQLQTKLARIQEEAGNKTVEASAGGNMVTVAINGRLELISLRIDPSVTDSSDVEMLQDLVIAAVNEGIRKAQKMMAEEMGKVAGGLKIPGLMP